MSLAFLFVTALLLATVAAPVVARLARAWHLLDPVRPDKLHRVAVPRIGGLALAVALGGSLALLGVVGPAAGLASHPRVDALTAIGLGATVVFAGGLWDDVRELKPLAKLAVQAAAAAIVMRAGIGIERVTLFGNTWELGVLAAPATLLWFLTLTNAFNLLDGLDGLAAGLTAIAAATCAAIAIARGDVQEALVLAALAGAATGFLTANFHPASIFLGDSGAQLCGFVLATTGVTGWQKGATTLALGVPLLIFALPIADTLGSVTRRAWRPATPTASRRWQGLAALARGDRRHIHHRLLDAGLSHRGTVLFLYAVSSGLSVVALLTARMP